MAAPLPDGLRPEVAAAASTGAAFFKVLCASDGSLSVELEEGTGNAFHLAPIIRKFTSAKLVIRGARRVTTVEVSTLYDALGLLRGLQYDAAQFNWAADVVKEGKATLGEVRYACYRLTRQASAFGVRVPRGGTAKVEIPGLDALVALVEASHAEQLTAARTLVAGGLVDFPSLCELYRPGTDLVDRGAATGLFGVPTAMRVRGCFTSRGKSLFGAVATFYAALEFVVAVGDAAGRFAVVEHHFPIAEFPGTRSTTEGYDAFIALSEGLRCELTARGQTYVRVASAPCYMEYQPGSFLPVPRGAVGGGGSGGGGFGGSRAPARARSGGRLMVDVRSAWARGVHCARAEGSASDAVKGVLKLVAQHARTSAATAAALDASGMGGAGAAGGAGGPAASLVAAAEEESSLELLLLPAPLPPSLTWLAWPVVAGFSFPAKSWGVAMVAGLRPVGFNEDAFARLVLPPERKKLIRALVMSHASPGPAPAPAALPSGGSGGSGGASSAGASAAAAPAGSSTALVSKGVDVIAGKGEGAIFLLHGPPGVGKTLTAEAIAELLHRPLYVVSMGELGTTPETLEERLLDILDLCAPWGALVLIDEAEMLLEARTKDDLIRNAMVCVMLRLLEYHSGILFLTTNRVASLDPAFQSRVQCALRYEALREADRAAIWRDMVAHAPVPVADDVAGAIAGLAGHELNGRQIKNALQLACALSRSEGVPLSAAHLAQTVGLTTAFLDEASGGASAP